MKEKYLEMIFGITSIVFIFGSILLFIKTGELERKYVQLSEEINQRKELESLLNNKYSLLFEEVSKDWKTYRNEKYGFEIRYPYKIMGMMAQDPLEVDLTSVYGMESIEDLEEIIISYIMEKHRDARLSNMDVRITVFQGELKPEFLDYYFHAFYEGKIKSEKAFCHQKLFYLNKEIPIYKIACFSFEQPYPPTSSVDEEYFIPNKKRKLFINLSRSYDLDIFTQSENYLAMFIFEKILSTFKIF